MAFGFTSSVFLNFDIQHAVFERSLNFSFIGISWQRKASGEKSILPLDPMEFFALFFFSLNGEDTIFYINFDSLLLDLRNLRLDHELFVSFSDVYSGRPSTHNNFFPSGLRPANRSCVAVKHVLHLDGKNRD